MIPSFVRRRSPLRQTAALATLLAAAAACAPTEPEPEPLAVRASLSAPVSSDTYVSITARIENVGAVTAYVPNCHLVQRLEGRRWVDDVHLGAACNSVPPEAVAAGAVVERAVHLLRARLPAADSTVLRVTFQVADDASYEPARVIAVRTAPRTVY